MTNERAISHFLFSILPTTMVPRTMCCIVATCLLLLVGASSAQQYSFDFSNAKHPAVSKEGASLFARNLQSGEPCNAEGSQIVCSYNFTAGNDVNETLITFVARCPLDSRYGFNFQRANGCVCQALVASPHSDPKICPCTVCQEGFGDVPVQVDCTNPEPVASSEEESEEESDGTEGSVTIRDDSRKLADGNNGTDTGLDPFIFDTCTSVDCSGDCNGTCSLSCEDSGSACDFCANNEDNMPTISPVGYGSGTLKDFSAGIHANEGLWRCSILASAAAVFVVLG